jgi:two-component system phosphate regulon response regulator PhoB
MAESTILIIEDERSLVEILTYNLTNEGFAVLSATDGQDGLRKAQTALPDLVILDLMLPVINGLEVCRRLRSDPRTQNIRILMLTAKSEETDEIVGFEMGADDYVTKPFKVKPLIHRIKACLRRPAISERESNVVAIGGIEVDRTHHVARLEGRELELTPTEFQLLWTFARQPGRPFSRAELMDASRGEDTTAMERTIDVHIRSLRRKLGEHASAIETVRGVGYRFKAE